HGSCEACHPHAACRLVTCNCKSGFVGDGITCYDLKLCAGGSCCRQGYRWSSELGCVDVDECSLPDQPCSPPQVCENTPGSFNCLVPPEDDLRSSPGSDSRSVQFQCGGRRCPVGEDCISVGGSSLCADPCQHYSVLNDAWRSTTNNGAASGYHCDTSVNWQGWYRLFLGNTSVQMPERCVEMYMCGTAAPLWLTDPHPQLLDGVVQRGVCGHWSSKCCTFRENPIHVKACYGNYYVYKFVPTTACYLAYCAGIVQCSSLILKDVKNIQDVWNALQLVTSNLFPLSHLNKDEVVSYLVASCSLLDRTEGGVSGLGAKAKSFMSLYRNANFTEAYPPGEVLLPVGSALHVGVSINETNDQFVVVLENCYATHTPNFDDLMRYVLIQNSDHRQVRVEESGSSLRARFSALLFLYQGDYRDVFLHCSLSLCDQRRSSCTPNCGRRMSRSVSTSASQKSLTVGPITCEYF
uniref:Uromodulin-like n=1 Tax=Salmo trutta TaxID=8032 RepID=A0A674BML2_SALTR